MFLTKYQKELIEKFQQGIITDVYSFLHSLNEISRYEYRGPREIFKLQNTNEKIGEEEVNIPEIIYIYNDSDFEIIKRKLFEFRFVTLYLEDQILIKSIRLNPSENCFFTPVINERFKKEIKFENVSDIINQFVFEGYKWRFEVSPAIDEFVERGYKSEAMFYQEEENRDRKKAQRLTRKIAYFSILGSAIIALTSAIFNYLTYTKEREVIIKNQIDTNKVLLVNPQLIAPNLPYKDSISINISK